MYGDFAVEDHSSDFEKHRGVCGDAEWMRRDNVDERRHYDRHAQNGYRESYDHAAFRQPQIGGARC